MCGERVVSVCVCGEGGVCVGCECDPLRFGSTTHCIKLSFKKF